MQWKGLTTTLIAAGALAGIGTLAPAAAADKSIIGRATVLNAKGAVSGQLQVHRRAEGLELRISVRGLTPGIHGVHLHGIGSCNAPDFTSAGSHLNPHGKMHGALNPQGTHLGDLPNVEVGGGGRGSTRAVLTGDAVTLARALFDGDGTAIVVHATADDYLTDPTGNSGGRIACGVVTRIR